jgi:hypothetical protein
VTYSEQASRVHAEARGDVSDEHVHKAQIIDIGVRAAWCPRRIGHIALSVAINIHCNRIRIEARVVHACLGLDCRGIRIVAVEAKNDGRSMVGVIELRNVY